MSLCASAQFYAKCEIYHKNLPNFVYIEVKLNENWVREMKEKPKHQKIQLQLFSLQIFETYLSMPWRTTGQQFITNHIWNTRKRKSGMEAFHCRILNVFFVEVFELLCETQREKEHLSFAKKYKKPKLKRKTSVKLHLNAWHKKRHIWKFHLPPLYAGECNGSGFTMTFIRQFCRLRIF